MKQGKQISTKQRWMRYSAYMLISAILGGFIGFFGVLIFKFSLPSYLNLYLTKIKNSDIIVL